MPDVHEQCLNELLQGTRGLKLPIPADEMQACRLSYRIERGTDGRRVIVVEEMRKGITFFPITEIESAGTNEREDIGYGCGCLIALPQDHSLKGNVGKVLECRAKIRRKYIHQRLENVTLSGGHYMTTKVQHLQINQPREAHRHEASSLLIHCWMREPRG